MTVSSEGLGPSEAPVVQRTAHPRRATHHHRNTSRPPFCFACPQTQPRVRRGALRSCGRTVGRSLCTATALMRNSQCPGGIAQWRSPYPRARCRSRSRCHTTLVAVGGPPLMGWAPQQLVCRSRMCATALPPCRAREHPQRTVDIDGNVAVPPETILGLSQKVQFDHQQNAPPSPGPQPTVTEVRGPTTAMSPTVSLGAPACPPPKLLQRDHLL